MSAPEEPAAPEPPLLEPTRLLLLAQALESCIRAERRAAGSAQAIVAQQPASMRAELRGLVELAVSLDSLANRAVISEAFRVSARSRLMERIGSQRRIATLGGPLAVSSAAPSESVPAERRVVHSRSSARLWRGLAGMVAAVLAASAAVTASASSLPGEPLYGLKQAQEELGVRLAPDDRARALALLRESSARLDETARLLHQGRTTAAAESALQYDRVVERAAGTSLVAADETSIHLESVLSQQQDELQTLLEAAPESARADLRQALGTTRRQRALAAQPTLAHSDPASELPRTEALSQATSTALGVPLSAADDQSTDVATPLPTHVAIPATPVPTLTRLPSRPIEPSTALVAQGVGPARSIGDVQQAALELPTTPGLLNGARNPGPRPASPRVPTSAAAGKPNPDVLTSLEAAVPKDNPATGAMAQSERRLDPPGAPSGPSPEPLQPRPTTEPSLASRDQDRRVVAVSAQAPASLPPPQVPAVAAPTGPSTELTAAHDATDPHALPTPPRVAALNPKPALTSVSAGPSRATQPTTPANPAVSSPKLPPNAANPNPGPPQPSQAGTSVAGAPAPAAPASSTRPPPTPPHPPQAPQPRRGG